VNFFGNKTKAESVTTDEKTVYSTRTIRNSTFKNSQNYTTKAEFDEKASSTENLVSNKTTDEITEKTTDETTDEMIDETTDKMIEDTTDEMIGETTDEIIVETTDEMIDETTDEMIDETIGEMTDATTNEMIDVTTDNMIHDTTDDMIDGTTDEMIYKTTDEFDAETTDKTYDKTTRKTVENTHWFASTKPLELTNIYRVTETTHLILNKEYSTNTTKVIASTQNIVTSQTPHLEDIAALNTSTNTELMENIPPLIQNTTYTTLFWGQNQVTDQMNVGQGDGISTNLEITTKNYYPTIRTGLKMHICIYF
jgi:sugar-specific transcriptional regulator TrmB